MIVDFHRLDDSVVLKFAVIITRDKHGFVFVKHKDRDTWEIPGGHIEVGESPLEAAERELKEETSALNYKLSEVCNYSVTVDDSTTYGRLFFADVTDYSGVLEHEIHETRAFSEIPDKLTYPKIQPLLFKEVINRVLG